MGAPAKFLFDVDFAAARDGKAAEPTFSALEHAARVAEAEKAAFEKGYKAAQSDATVESGRRMADALERISAGLTMAIDALKTIEARLESEAVEVAVAVARKLVPALIAQEPFAEIATLAGNCFRELVAAPHVAVRVNDALYATAREKLEDIARARNFEGRLVVLAEPDIVVGDCRIEWADGGINRDSAATDAAIGEAVAGYIRARRRFSGTDEMARRHDNG